MRTLDARRGIVPTQNLPRLLSPEAAARETRLRQRLRTDLTAWAEHILQAQGQTLAAHHRLLLDGLQKVATAQCDRFMVLMPPGAAKSTYTSVLFPAWWMQAHPGGSVVAASHTAELARFFGSRVRDLVQRESPRLGFGLSRGEAAATRFSTTRGGSYYGVGVRGPVTGRRADLILIDDPVKSVAEADRPRMRNHMWDWFRADLLTRLRPGGVVVLAMTRWHRDDLAGRLLEGDDDWTVLRLPALAEADDPLGRSRGEALWPAWEDEAALQRKKRSMGDRIWMAMYQQAPQEESSLVFGSAKMRVLTAEPEIEDAVRAWDLASCEAGVGNPDWTVGLKLGRCVDGTFVILDVVRLQGDPACVEAKIREVAERDGPGVRISLPQDPGQAGRAQVQYLTRRLAGFAVSSSPETGSKSLRAMPVAAQVTGGTVTVMAAPWNRRLVDELVDFPNGMNDDQVDALSRAFGLLGLGRPESKAVLTNLFGR